LIAREERALGGFADTTRRWIDGFQRTGTVARPLLALPVAAAFPGPDVRSLVDPLDGTALANQPGEDRVAPGGSVNVGDSEAPAVSDRDVAGRRDGWADHVAFSPAGTASRPALGGSRRDGEIRGGDDFDIEHGSGQGIDGAPAADPIGFGSASKVSDRRGGAWPVAGAAARSGTSLAEHAFVRPRASGRSGDGSEETFTRDLRGSGFEPRPARPVRRELHDRVKEGTAAHTGRHTYAAPAPEFRWRAGVERRGAPLRTLASDDADVRAVGAGQAEVARLAAIVDRVAPEAGAPWQGAGSATDRNAPFADASGRPSDPTATDGDHGARIANLLERAVRRLDAIEGRLAGARDGFPVPNAAPAPEPEVAWLEDDDLADRLHRILRGQALRRGIDLS
jgi:hypothetical protein